MREEIAYSEEGALLLLATYPKGSCYIDSFLGDVWIIICMENDENIPLKVPVGGII